MEKQQWKTDKNGIVVGPKSKLNDIFFSDTEKIFFSVAGYTDNTENVMQHVAMLAAGAQEVADLCRVSVNEVKTIFITTSRRYKMMRVFFVEKPKEMPKNTFKMGKDWTMIKWLTS